MSLSIYDKQISPFFPKYSSAASASQRCTNDDPSSDISPIWDETERLGPEFATKKEACDFFSFKGYKIVVIKNTNKLLLYKGHQLVKIYPIARSDRVGRKERSGDHKTPEGIGSLSQVALTSDVNGRPFIMKMRMKFERQPWKDLLFHGGGADVNWTWGCIALNDDDAMELYNTIKGEKNGGVGTPFMILPENSSPIEHYSADNHIFRTIDASSLIKTLTNNSPEISITYSDVPSYLQVEGQNNKNKKITLTFWGNDSHSTIIVNVFDFYSDGNLDKFEIFQISDGNEEPIKICSYLAATNTFEFKKVTLNPSGKEEKDILLPQNLSEMIKRAVLLKAKYL